MTAPRDQVREAMALVLAYGRAVRENQAPEHMRVARDRVIAALAAAGVGQRYASHLERYAAANRGQADAKAKPSARLAAGREAGTIAADIERATCTALGIEPPPPPLPAATARTGRQRPAHGRG